MMLDLCLLLEYTPDSLPVQPDVNRLCRLDKRCTDHSCIFILSYEDDEVDGGNVAADPECD